MQKPEIEIPEEIQAKLNERTAEINRTKEELEKKWGTITVHTFTPKDSDGVPTGEIIVGYFKQPHILVAARAMDEHVAGRFYEAGYNMWEGCIIRPQSSKEIDHDKYKLPLLPRLGQMLEMVAPDVKKS